MSAMLHAGWGDGTLLVWAERALGPDQPLTGRRRAAVPPHPAAMDSEALVALFADCDPGLGHVLEASAGRRLTAWLPTAGGTPIPAMDLEVVGSGPVELRPWAIPALALPAEAVAALLSRVGGGGWGRACLAGPDLMFWAAAYSLALAAAARGALLPSVRSGPLGTVAVWEPLWTPGEAAALAKLAGAMPGACRALGAAADAPAAASVLQQFMGAMLDRLPRAAAPVPAAGRTVHDRWLAALAGPDAALDGTPEELASLVGTVREWSAPVAVRHEAAYRLCFRLEDPPPDDIEAWHVRYVLEASDDPSLRLDAERVWEPRSGVPATAPAVLLAALGRASTLVPEVARSLEDSRPTGYRLDLSGAHTFLAETAPLLEQAGFGLMLPSWWVGRGASPRLVARAQARAPKFTAQAGLGLQAVVEFDWTVALGGETLSQAELERLAGLKVPLVRLRGRWVQVGQAEIQAALALWRGGAASRGTLRDALRLAAGEPPGPGLAVAVELAGAEGWIAAFLESEAGGDAFAELPPPPGLRATLRPYQLRGYSWLAFLTGRHLGACLADDMGLGKTIQTLALVARDWEADRRPVLLVCPTSVLGNWGKEAERFVPHLAVMAHHGTDRVRDEPFLQAAASSALVLTTYPLLVRDQELLGRVSWRGVVLDEAQNIKNAETKQARAARCLPADYRLALTGTPVENNVGDLWSLMAFLNPGLLGGQSDFRRRFFTPIQVDRDPAAIARLGRLAGPFMLRRLKTDPAVVADLPAKNEMKVYCTLTREQASLYAAVVAELAGGLAQEAEDGLKRRGQILAALAKLKQVCNHPAQFLADGSPLPGRSGKLARLEEMLEEAVAAGDRVLVFTQFAAMGALLQGRLREVLGREVLLLHGGVPRAEREALVERFQAPVGGPPVFVLSLKAGGTGLNLTAANRVIHFDRWWNPAVENQATDRAFRIGQRRDVQVHKFVCAGTLEERIDAMIEAKREIAARIVGSGEGWLTELSAAELREVLSLRPEAVED